MEDLQKDNARLQLEIAHSTTALKAEQSHSADLLHTLAAERAVLEGMLAKLAEAETVSAQSAAERRLLLGRVQELREQCTQVTEERTCLLGEVEILKLAKVRMANDLEKLLHTRDFAQTRAVKLGEQLGLADVKISKLEAENDRYKTLFDDFHNRKSDDQSCVESLQAQSLRLEESLQIVSSELEAARLSVEESVRERAALQLQVGRLQSTRGQCVLE